MCVCGCEGRGAKLKQHPVSTCMQVTTQCVYIYILFEIANIYCKKKYTNNNNNNNK